LDPSVTLAFLDTDAIQPAAAADDSLAPGGGVANLGEGIHASCCGLPGGGGVQVDGRLHVQGSHLH
jgi:hypothetical protein